MTQMTTRRASVRRADTSVAVLTGLGASLAVAVLWVLLAFRSPSTTYHFAPIVVTVASPYAARAKAAGAFTGRRALVIVAAGAAISLAAVVALASTRHLTGPTLWDSGNATTEAIAFTAAGSVCGYWVAWRQRRWLGKPANADRVPDRLEHKDCA